MLDQHQLLDELKTDENFLLIILDACRYDKFVELDKEIDGDIEKVDSDVPNTHTWIKENWSDGPYDITYISAMPWVHTQPVDHPHAGTYDGSAHFNRVIPCHNKYWSDKYKTTLPQDITREVNNCSDNNILVHYFQPHFPHIDGPLFVNPEAGPFEDYEEEIKRAVNIEKVPEHDDITDEFLDESYTNNLKYVWNNGVSNIDLLQSNTDKKIIITADHGENLGERGKYGHNSYDDIVTTVPWMRVR